MHSPIDLDARSANGADLGALKLENLFVRCTTCLTNDTQTVVVTLPNKCYLSGGPLRARYEFKSMHFHWGRTDQEGSEHTIQGKRMASEAHFVFKFEYEFKAPVEILETTKKLTDLKWKIDHPDEEEEEDEDDDDFIEEEEEETEEEMLERYIRDSANFEILQKLKLDEWNEKRLQKMECDKLKGEKEIEELEKDEVCVKSKKEILEKQRIQEKENNWKKEVANEWNTFRSCVESQSNLKLSNYTWHLLQQKYEETSELVNRRNIMMGIQVQHSGVGTPKQIVATVPEEEKNSAKALKLETDAMCRMEWNALEKSKAKYLEWIKREDLLDKTLKRELRDNFETYLEEIEEREDLEDEPDISEEEKRKMRILWTIMDNKKEEAVREKLKNVLNRRKRELNEICTTKICSTAVISLLFKIDDAASSYDLFSYLTQIKEPWQQIYVDGNLLTQFESGLTTGEYFTYTGCLTFSPYSENVTWICMREPMPILSSQLKELREMKSDWGKIESNSRETQSLGNRSVFYNKKVVTSKEPPCPGKDSCSCEAAPPRKDWPRII